MAIWAWEQGLGERQARLSHRFRFEVRDRFLLFGAAEGLGDGGALDYSHWKFLKDVETDWRFETFPRCFG